MTEHEFKALNKRMRDIEFENQRLRHEYRELVKEILDHEESIGGIRKDMVKVTRTIEQNQNEFNRIAAEIREQLKTQDNGPTK